MYDHTKVEDARHEDILLGSPGYTLQQPWFVNECVKLVVVVEVLHLHQNATPFLRLSPDPNTLNN